MATEKEKLRIDKYLWAIRIFKTRSLSTEACKAGRIKLGGQSLKASHEVKIGEEYSIQKGGEKKIVLVTALLMNRVDAATAAQYFQDLSPAAEPGGMASSFYLSGIKRPRGIGRPTKKQRRDIDEFTADKSGS